MIVTAEMVYQFLQTQHKLICIFTHSIFDMICLLICLFDKVDNEILSAILQAFDELDEDGSGRVFHFLKTII